MTRSQWHRGTADLAQHGFGRAVQAVLARDCVADAMRWEGRASRGHVISSGTRWDLAVEGKSCVACGEVGE
jgi:hypothetical protein